MCEHDFSLAEASEKAVMTPGTCVNEAVFYYTCEKCGAIESDGNDTFTGEKNPENHNPSDIWESDYSGHWHECKDCKKNWILLHIFRIMKDTLRKSMQLPVRYVDG